MNKEAVLAIIAKNYTPLTSECQEELLKVAKISIQQKGNILVKEGQYADKIFFIIQGCARAYYLKDGKDISDWFAFEHDFITAINSYFEKIPSPHFIELVEDAIILELLRSDVDRLSDKYHDFERLSKVIITKTMLQHQQRIASIQFHSAEEKYDKLLSIHPNITQRIPLTHIASYIGITLETLSRIRKRKIRI